MATLTGEYVSATYESLLKVTDNLTLTGTLKDITDGFGNASALQLSTTEAKVNGVLTVTGNVTASNLSGSNTGDETNASIISKIGYTPANASALASLVPYTGATGDVNLGDYQLVADQLTFDQTPSRTAGVGVLRWNDADGTLDLGLKGGNVTLQIGQEQVIRVVNRTGSNLSEANYQVVRVDGAQGNRLKIALAQANNDANSAETLGLVTETINDNQEGFITTSGLVRNINTTGSLQGETWADGDMLYLSGTTAGRLTNIKPSAPIHNVIMGYVVRAHATQGQIYVKVDNGYELNELHNVAISSPIDGQVLAYESASGLWKNASNGNVGGSGTANYLSKWSAGTSLTDSLVYDNGTNVGIGTATPSYKLHVVGSGLFTGDITSNGLIYGNIVNSTFTIGSKLGLPVLGSALTADPTYHTLYSNNENQITWLQPSAIGGDFASTFKSVNTADRLYTFPDNSGTIALTSDITTSVNGTTNYIPKFTSANAIGNSIIQDNGSGVGIGVAPGFLYKFDVTGFSRFTGNATITGNLGIGTTSPSTKLHLTGANELLRLQSDNGYIQWFDNANSTALGYIGSNSSAYNIIAQSGSAPIILGTNSTERMRITPGGNVGIGISTPSEKLEVSGSILLFNPSNNKSEIKGVFGNIISDDIVNGLFTVGEGFIVRNTISNTVAFKGGGSSEVMRFSAGNVGIGTTSPSYPLHVATNVSGTSIYANSDIVAYSDQSVKENIRPIKDALDRVLKSRGVIYDRIDSGVKDNVGFIAQELEVEFPELVVENEDGTKAVKYQNAVAVLFEAIKEQQQQINKLMELIK